MSSLSVCCIFSSYVVFVQQRTGSLRISLCYVLCGDYSLPYAKAEMFSFVCAVETIGFRLVFGF